MVPANTRPRTSSRIFEAQSASLYYEADKMAASNPHFEPNAKYDHYDFPTTAPDNKPGHPGHTTKEQDAQVEQLRMMLESEGYTDRLDTLTLLRFLRARKFDVNASKAM